MLWLDKLKIAIIEKDTDSMAKLFKELPEFKSLEEMKEAQALIKESVRLLLALKEESAIIIKQIQKNRNFLKSTQAPQKNKFDIKY